MDLFMEDLIDTRSGPSRTAVRPLNSPVSPPPYSPTANASSDDESFRPSIEKPKLDAPQSSNMGSPPSYSSRLERPVVTHVFVAQPTMERACCGCMSLRTAATCIVLGKAVLCIISLITLGMLANDKRWSDLLNMDGEEIRFLYGLLITALVLESISLLGNLIGIFGTLQGNEIAVMICIVTNIIINVIVIIVTNIIEPMSSLSVETLIGLAWEIYMYYILIRYYKYLRAKRRSHSPAQEMVEFVSPSVTYRPTIVRNV